MQFYNLLLLPVYSEVPARFSLIKYQRNCALSKYKYMCVQVKIWMMQPVQFVRLHSVQDPFDFQAAFDELMECSSSVENWGQIRKELDERGVRLTLNTEVKSYSVHTVNVVT